MSGALFMIDYEEENTVNARKTHVHRYADAYKEKERGDKENERIKRENQPDGRNY